ncbi:MAG: TPM domain-containing protein [Victivallaceae bacterium]|nr:TPM domain-containing protein [Victivallaceae bacterium]
MKRIGIFFSCLFFFWAAAAFEAPELTGRFVDRAGVLNSAEAAKTEKLLRLFEKATGGQLFVVLLPDFGDASPEEAGIALMDKWKPGQRGKDNGAILLLAMKTHRMRLEIGYGWEGTVNDAKAGDILRLAAGFFRENRYADGIAAGVNQLAFDLTGKALDPDLPLAEEEENSVSPLVILLLFVSVILLFRRFPFLLMFLGGFGGRGGGFGGGGYGGFGGGFGGGGGGRGGGGGASGSW